LLVQWRGAVGLKGIVIEEVVWTIREMGIDARAADWNAYGCLCLHLAEIVEDLACDDPSARRAWDLLSAWVSHSGRYIGQPSNLQTVRTLLEGLSGATWHAPFDWAEQDMIFQALLRGSVKH
jgi:hypothetical protein